jgi:hypothetical protein
MLFVTFIFIHFVIMCDVLLWRTYETHPALSFKFGCDSSSLSQMKQQPSLFFLKHG